MATDVATRFLVTTDWLAEHSADPGLVVAEVDENPDLYDEGDIPGSVKLHWREDLPHPPLPARVWLCPSARSESLRPRPYHVPRRPGDSAVVLVDVRSPQEYSGELM